MLKYVLGIFIGGVLGMILYEYSDVNPVEKRRRRLLYRVLREDETGQHGIAAKNPNARQTIESHVRYGSNKNNSSQYISCTEDLETAKKFAKLAFKNRGQRVVRIAVIDLDMLETLKITVIPFDKVVAETTTMVAYKFAKAYKEVLVERCIPKTCILEIFPYWQQ